MTTNNSNPRFYLRGILIKIANRYFLNASRHASLFIFHDFGYPFYEWLKPWLRHSRTYFTICCFMHDKSLLYIAPSYLSSMRKSGRKTTALKPMLPSLRILAMRRFTQAYADSIEMPAMRSIAAGGVMAATSSPPQHSERVARNRRLDVRHQLISRWRCSHRAPMAWPGRYR